MDTITQAVLGAVIGGAAFSGALGKRAWVFGAICGLLPDADVIMGLGGEWTSLVHHRGVTHSLLVLPFAALPVGWLGWRSSDRQASPRTWIHLAFWALITHPLLDTCTSYGTQLLAPLTDRRFSTDAVGIIDLLYTTPLLLATAMAASRRIPARLSRRAAALALGLSSLYLGIGHGVTARALDLARRDLQQAGAEVARLRCLPPPLLPGLRRVVARDDDGVLWMGNVSVISPQPIKFTKRKIVPDPLIEAALEAPEGRIMQWFANGFLHAHRTGPESVLLTDLRYGMYTDPTWTPFAATAHFDTAGSIVSIVRAPRRRDLDARAELGAAWDLLFGLSE